MMPKWMGNKKSVVPSSRLPNMEDTSEDLPQSDDARHNINSIRHERILLRASAGGMHQINACWLRRMWRAGGGRKQRAYGAVR